MSAEDRVPAKGQPRQCPTCRDKRDLFVKAQRNRAGAVVFNGYCMTCGNAVGEVPRSKVAEADQIRLELELEANNPPTFDLFAGDASAPTELNRLGDGQ